MFDPRLLIFTHLSKGGSLKWFSMFRTMYSECNISLQINEKKHWIITYSFFFIDSSWLFQRIPHFESAPQKLYVTRLFSFLWEQTHDKNNPRFQNSSYLWMKQSSIKEINSKNVYIDRLARRQISNLIQLVLVRISKLNR